MAILPETKKALIQAGLATSLVKHETGFLVASGDVPGGKRGRPGKGYADLTPEQHITIVLGLGGQPSDAPKNARKLRRFLNNKYTSPLGKYLEGWAIKLAKMSPEARQDYKDRWMFTGASLLLDPDAGIARVNYSLPHDADSEVTQATSGSAELETIEFTDPDKPHGTDAFLEGPHRDVLVWRRQPTEISLVVLIVVAELLAGTMAQQNDLPPSEGGKAEASHSENEAAADPARPTARFDYATDRPLTAAGEAQALEDSGGKEEYQAFPFGGRSPVTKGDPGHGLRAR